jgi:hypothetical protein
MGFLGLGGDKVTHTSQSIDQSSQDYQDWLRRYAQGAAGSAAAGGPWAQGSNEYIRRAGAGLTGMTGRYGDMYDQGMAGVGIGMQTGLGGLGAYANPAYRKYVNATDDQFQQRMSEAFSQGGILASAAGQPANANVRGELFRSNLVGNQMNARQAELGQAQMGITQNAIQAMLADRARAGQLGYGMAGGAAQGLGNTYGQQYDFGQGLRGIGREQAMDPAVRNQFGLGLGRNAYIGPYGTTGETREEGSFLGDLASLALPVAGMVMGGPAGAMAGGAAGQAMSGLSGSTMGGSLGQSGNFFGGIGFQPGPSTTFMGGGGGLLSNFPGLSMGGY